MKGFNRAPLDPGVLLTRRVAPVLVCLIVVFGLVRWVIGRDRLFDSADGIAATALLSIVAVVVVLSWAASIVRAEVRRRQDAERAATYRQLARNLPGGGVFLFDADLRYVLVESSGLEAIGYTSEGLEGRTIFEVFPPEILGDLEVLYRDALAGHERRQEMTIQGETYMATVVPDRDETGTIVGGLALSQRITEERRLRDQLFQAQKMEAIGQLAGGVAHDFNNLLLAIRGYAQLAQVEPDEPTHLEQVLHAADRAAALTGRLLAFSRQQVVQPAILDVNEVVLESKPLLDPLLGDHIELAVEMDPAVPTIVADRHQLGQILMNLAANAHDAMPDGGRLTIATGRTSLADGWDAGGDLPAGDYVRISVTDSGVGIPPENVPRLFEPFFTTKDEAKGTGLGLSTVYGIARQYGGSVHVYSEPGRGSTFTVYFPPADESGVAEPPAARPGSVERSDRATVILVEDEQTVSALVARMLEKLGHDVTVAARPDEAIEIIGRSPPFSLLMTDFALPELNGWVLAKQVASMSPSTRILFMSGYTNHAALEEAVMSGEAKFLQKPFSAEQLAAAVAGALDA